MTDWENLDKKLYEFNQVSNSIRTLNKQKQELSNIIYEEFKKMPKSEIMENYSKIPDSSLKYKLYKYIQGEQ